MPGCPICGNVYRFQRVLSPQPAVAAVCSSCAWFEVVT